MKPHAQEKVHLADTKTVRTRRTEVIIVSADDGFLIELGPVLGDRYRTRTVDHPDAIAGATDASHWIAIVDATELSDARATVARMEQKHRGAEIIVVTKSAEEWHSAVARGSVMATVPRDQLGGMRLVAILASAESRLASAHGGDTSITASVPIAAVGGGARSRSGLSKPILIGGVVAGLAAIALIIVLATHHSSKPSRGSAGASHAVTEQAAAPVPTASPFELLSAARIAFHEERLLPRQDGEPRGDSALELYTQVLVQDPKNEEALEGVRRLFSVGKTRIQADLASGKFDEAVRMLGYFKSAGLDDDALHDVEASVAAARPKWLTAKAQERIAAGDFTAAEALIAQLEAAGGERNVVTDLRRSIDAKKSDQQLSAMASEVKSAIEAGNLIDPASDNARTRLTAMKSVNRSNPQTLQAQRDLQAALVARVQDATRKDQFEVAQRYLTAASENNPAADLSEPKRALQAEMESVSQRAAQAAAEARAKTAAATAASAAAAAPKSYLPARPTSPLAVSYPSSASAQKVQGFVIVEFTLHPDGSASEGAVVEAQPSKVFDHVAVAAVLKGHYDASALTDKQPQRARIRLTFKPST